MRDIFNISIYKYNNIKNPPPIIDVVTIGKQINKNMIKKHIAILASDEFEGREVGEPGEEMAAQYMSNYFSRIGIKENLIQNAKCRQFQSDWPLLRMV